MKYPSFTIELFKNPKPKGIGFDRDWRWKAIGRWTQKRKKKWLTTYATTPLGAINMVIDLMYEDGILPAKLDSK